MESRAATVPHAFKPFSIQHLVEDPLCLDPFEDEELSPAEPIMEETTTISLPAVRSLTIHDRAMSKPEEPAAVNMSHSAYERDASPPPTLSPSLALDAIPILDRSVSTASSSMSSRRSSSSRLSDPGLTSSKRRGYMRPQVTNYSESARNRESVMSLGSIAHLQYYFARTGLLDGKGAQVARPDMLRRKSSNNLNGASSRAGSMGAMEASTGDGQSGLLSPTMAGFDSCAVSDAGFMDSPLEQEGEVDWESQMMLPPTVSTYNQKPIYVAPPPDLTMLRRELTEAMEDALKVLKETDSVEAPEGIISWSHMLAVSTNTSQTYKAGTRYKAFTSSTSSLSQSGQRETTTQHIRNRNDYTSSGQRRIYETICTRHLRS